MNALFAWAAAALASVQIAAQTPGLNPSPPPAPVPEVSVGRIERLPPIVSRFVDARHVDVWLPADFSPSKRYQVLYMHDGQMLFDASKSWNRQAWDVHLSVARLMQTGRIADTLVVGIWNNGALRRSEYYPQKFLPYVAQPARDAYIAQALQGQPRSDLYLRYLVEELKPAIDQRYPTLPGRAHTAIMGSSMGGLISIYAMSEYPEVFGAAAGLSTQGVGAWKANSALPMGAFQYLERHLADPATHRLYMDHGTTELDALYAPYQTFIDQIVADRGYTEANSMSRVFAGAGHNERAWAARLDAPLQFILRPP